MSACVALLDIGSEHAGLAPYAIRVGFQTSGTVKGGRGWAIRTPPPHLVVKGLREVNSEPVFSLFLTPCVGRKFILPRGLRACAQATVSLSFRGDCLLPSLPFFATSPLEVEARRINSSCTATLNRIQ